MTVPSPSTNSVLSIERLWDTWCLLSIIGIWPRFIEPACLVTRHITIPLPSLPKELEGLRILQFSDLHFSKHTKKGFLQRLSKRIQKEAADVIVFTGDLLSYGELYNAPELTTFLQSLKPPFGCYVVLGNHDYSEYVSLATDGKVRKISQHLPTLLRGFARLFSFKDDSSQAPEVTEPVLELAALKEIYKQADCTLLHNETIQIGSGFGKINITGLGDLMAQQCLPDQAFAQYNYNFPGIVLSHNPDSFTLLDPYPGDLLLFGHTHGGQVNLPYIWKQITCLKNHQLKSGLFYIHNKFLYVNRGVGAVFPFRWFALPEITVFQLVRHGPVKQASWQRLFPQETTQEAVCGTS